MANFIHNMYLIGKIDAEAVRAFAQRGIITEGEANEILA